MTVRAARIVLLLLLAATVQAKPDATAKHKAKLAKVWVDYARWLQLKGLKTEADQTLARARAADPANKDLAQLAVDIEALEDSRVAEPDLEARRQKAHKDAAKIYDRLGKIDAGYLVDAVRLDPSKARLGKMAGLVKKLAGNRSNAVTAGRILVQLRELGPKGKYDSLEIELARKDVALIKHPDHAMVGFLSIPKGWKKGGSYPVLVTVDGAGSSFLGSARTFAKARGGRKFLVLAPCSFSNTNQLQPKKYAFYAPELLTEHNSGRITFDLGGLKKLLEVVAERYGGQKKIGITGFSGGGNLCYGMTILWPDRILFSAPACANFSGMGLRDAEAVEDGGPPIHILTGANDQHRDYTFGKKDSPGIEPQTNNAVATLERLGFKNFRRTMLPGVGHSNCATQVWKFGDEVMK